MKNKKQCKHPLNCERVAVKKGLCELHYRRLMRTGNLGEVATIRNMSPLAICKVENCRHSTWSKGLCNMHYKRLNILGDTGTFEEKRVKNIHNKCIVENCENIEEKKHLCKMHYQRKMSTGQIGSPGSHRFDNAPEGFKTCTTCEEVLLLSNFSKSKGCKFGVNSKCRICQKYTKLEKIYGLSRDKYDKLMSNAVCAICKTSDTLVIDHCHISGKVRGVLCRMCNVGIGHFLENKEILKSAIIYINKFNETITEDKNYAII